MAMLRHIKSAEQKFFEWADRKGARFIGSIDEDDGNWRNRLFLFYIERKDRYYGARIMFHRKNACDDFTNISGHQDPYVLDGTGVIDCFNKIIDMHNARIQISEATAISNSQNERSQSL